MRSKKLFTVFLAIAGLFLFSAPSAYAAFTDVSAAATYADLQDPNTDAVIIDVRTVDERNGLTPPWSSLGTIDSDGAFNGTPKWRVNGKTYLPISIPWWIDENTGYSATSPDDPTEVTNIIEGLLERGVIDFNTKLYFLCRTAVRSHDMATWVDGRTFTSTTTGSGTFANLFDIDEPSTLYDGGMQEWNASSLPKYMGTSWSSYTYTPPMVFATFDGSTTFTVSVLEPSNGAGFTEPTVNRVSLQIFDDAGLKGSEVAFSLTDTVAGTLWTDYTFNAAVSPYFDIPNGSYTWRAYAANNPGRGLANNALGVTDISPTDAQNAAATGDGIIIDVRSVEEHSNFGQNWASTGACGNPNAETANQGAPIWVDTATNVTMYSPNVPFWISGTSSAYLPENTTEFENAFAALKEAGVIDFNTKIYLICRSGYRSYWSGVYLQKLGFRNVYNIDGANTYNAGGMLEWSADGLAKYESTDYAPPPQVYAVSPADGYANAATGSFTVGILEPSWGCSTLSYPPICNVDLKVGGTTVATDTTDTVAGAIWTKYTLPYTPAAQVDYTWNAYAYVDFGCDGTGSADEAWTSTSSYAAADDISLRRTLDVSTSIEVTDSVGTVDDLEMNYSDTVAVNSSSASETITVTNNGTSLTMSDTSFATLGQAKFDPFTITDNCSTAGTLSNGGTCTIGIVFSPTAAGSFGKIIRINSDDATVPQVKVAMCGTTLGAAPRWTSAVTADTTLSDSDLLSLLSDCAVPAAVAGNSAPDAPELLYPSDGDANVPTSVKFAWTESADADGDAVSYQICYAPEGTELTDSNCYPVEGDVAKGSSSTLYAGLGSGAGLLLFGMMLAGSARRRKLALLIGLMAITAMFLVSCGKSTTDTSSNDVTDTLATVSGIKTYSATLQPGTDYTWKVIASDGPNSAESEEASFTTGD